MIYLDYAATFPPFPEVIATYAQIASDVFGNPAAIHSAGSRARSVLHSSRKRLAGLLNVRPEELYFTSGATESNNWAVIMGCRHPILRRILYVRF